MAKHGLGKGLNALMADKSASETPDPGDVSTVAIEKIVPNKWQPRQTFDPEALDELVASIQTHGILQPLVVRQADLGYELIAGERRLRASKLAGISEVPIRVIDVDNQAALELAIIENVQREDLNPVEEAESYQVLAEQFNLTQEEIAKRVGKSRAGIANCLRLLGLPPEVQEMLASGELSAGHAKVLLSLGSKSEMSRLAKVIVDGGMSIQELETLLSRFRSPE